MDAPEMPGHWNLAEKHLCAVLEFLGDIRRFPALWFLHAFSLLPLNATLKEDQAIRLAG